MRLCLSHAHCSSCHKLALLVSNMAAVRWLRYAYRAASAVIAEGRRAAGSRGMRWEGMGSEGCCMRPIVCVGVELYYVYDTVYYAPPKL
jgi:hypothetical protein